jgi:hypothetical protein
MEPGCLWDGVGLSSYIWHQSRRDGHDRSYADWTEHYLHIARRSVRVNRRSVQHFRHS